MFRAIFPAAGLQWGFERVAPFDSHSLPRESGLACASHSEVLLKSRFFAELSLLLKPIFALLHSQLDFSGARFGALQYLLGLLPLGKWKKPVLLRYLHSGKLPGFAVIANSGIC